MTMNIGAYARALILSNSSMTNQQVLDKIKEKHADAKTTMACIAWYKSDMRKNGLLEKKESVKKMTAEEYKTHLLAQLAELDKPKAAEVKAEAKTEAKTEAKAKA